MNNVLEEIKPDIYKGIVGEDHKDYNKLIHASFKLQCKLADRKSEFANKILYKCIITEQKDTPKVPKYIQDGFDWLLCKLKSNGTDNDNNK